MFFIRQSATHKVVLGPAVAVGDGFTPITNLAISTSDEAEAILHDNGTIVDISGYTWAAIATADGYYHLTLQAAISGTVGHLTIVVNDDSLCLPLRADFTIVEEAVYDSLFAASAPGPLTAAAVNAQVDLALSDINLDHFAKTATGSADMTNEVADNTILSRMLANGDTSAFVPSTHGLQPIRDAITAAADALYVPDASSTVTDGTVESGTYASAAADDGTDWVIQMESDNDTNVDVTCEFNMGANRLATELDINGNFDAGGNRSCQVYAWNYTTTSWDKLSSAGVTTEMRNSASDKDYVFALNAAHTDDITTPGEVKIRFYTDGDANDEDDLRLDYVRITGTSAGGTSPQAIASAVHTELDSHLHHIPMFTGMIRYVQGTTGNDGNSGENPDVAFLTIGAAVAASSAGDMIRVFAATYSEAVTLAADGLELWCEIGTDIDGSTGVPITVSGNGCRVNGAHLNPDAGQIGCIVSGSDVYIELCESHGTGLTGFQFATTAERCQVRNCVAEDFTSVGFEVKGPDNTFIENLARGNGGTEKGFHLSDTAAHRNLFGSCKTVDCATAGWTTDAGADDNLFDGCSDSVGCGAKVDSGANNAWRNFKDSDLQAADDALAAYAPPTKAEMDTAHGLLATVAKQDVIDGIVDAILLDTGTDGVVLKAAGLNADAVTEIVTAIFAKTGLTATGTITFGEMMKMLNAIAHLNFVESGGTLLFYDDDWVSAASPGTLLFTVTVGEGTGRTVVDA